MGEFITINKLEDARQYLIPYIFSENYFNILKDKLSRKKLSSNEQYYYNHFIKKKLKGMMELFDIEENMVVKNKALIRKDRLVKAMSLLKKYSRMHKNMKILITGSFLYNEKYHDVDVFVISKYVKEDYRKGNVHVNFLPADIEKTLFYKSISALCIANFTSDEAMTEKITLADVFRLYELVVLLMMQNDNYAAELRELILKAEYISSKIILNSLQLKEAGERIKRSKNPLIFVNKYFIAKIINSSNPLALSKLLHKFMEKNTLPEKGREIYPNWKIYNETYKEALEVVV